MKTSVTFIKNATVMYPMTASDYDVLKSLGIPLLKIESEQAPVLGQLLKRKKVKVTIVPFEPIEARMFETKVLPKWKSGLTVTANSVVLSHSKDVKEESVDKLLAALKTWYRKNYTAVDVNIKRTSKKVTVTLKKSPLATK